MSLDVLGFQGVRYTGDTAAVYREPSRDVQIRDLIPSGSNLLTKLLAGHVSTSPTTAQEFTWAMRIAPKFRGEIAAISSSATAVTPLTSVTAYSTTFYIHCTPQLALQFSVDDTIRVSKVGATGVVDVGGSIQGSVVENVYNLESTAATARIKVVATSDNATLSDEYNYVQMAGNSRPEYSTVGTPVTWDPRPRSNYVQIFDATALATGSAQATKQVYGDAWADARRQAIELFQFRQETGLLMSRRGIRNGSNNMPQRTMDGIEACIHRYSPENVFDITKATNPIDADISAGTAFYEYGQDYLRNIMAQLNYYTSGDRMALVGDKALLAINTLVDHYPRTYYVIDEKSTTFGALFTRYRTPHGVIALNSHPFFKQNPLFDRVMMILDGNNLKRRVLRDTFTIKEGAGEGMRDGTGERLINEWGLEFHMPETAGIIYNFGVDKP